VAVEAVIGSRELAGPGWRLAAERPVERADRISAGDGWVAVVGIRRGLKLLVTGGGGLPDVRVEAWAGDPGDSADGVAVVSLPDGGLALARVPLCSCGTRGCGNAGVQFGKPMPADDLPALAGLLRGLPWTEAVPSRSGVLRGDGLAALPVRHFTGRAKVVFHGTRVQDGVRVPVTRVLYDGSGAEEHERGHPERG
jgi:hypothetical protein